jgi:hypothetical protein
VRVVSREVVCVLGWGEVGGIGRVGIGMVGIGMVGGARVG